MKRSRDGLSGMLNDMARRLEWAARGRIHFYSGMWRLMEPDDDTPVGHYGDEHGRLKRLVSEDSLGRKIECIAAKCVHCRHPKWEGSEYVLMGIFRNIPASVCRKCEHYRKGGGKPKYPTCAYMAKPNPERVVGQQFAKMLTEATAKAEDVLR